MSDKEVTKIEGERVYVDGVYAGDLAGVEPPGVVPPQPYGYGPPPPQTVVYVQQNAPAAPVVVVKAPFNHALHLVITICTCGLWLPVWIILAIAH